MSMCPAPPTDLASQVMALPVVFRFRSAAPSSLHYTTASATGSPSHLSKYLEPSSALRECPDCGHPHSEPVHLSLIHISEPTRPY